MAKKKGEILVLDNLASMFAEKLASANVQFTMEPNVLNEGYTKFIYESSDEAKVQELAVMYGISHHSSKVKEKRENKVLKFVMKAYFLTSIFLILVITFAFVVVQFGEDWQWVNSLSFVTFDQLQTLYHYGLRILVFSLGLSILISVTVYAIEEEINYTSRTTMIIVFINLAYLVVLIFLLKKILRKKGSALGIMGGII